MISSKKQKFVKSAATLDALSPLKVIGRGYSMVTENGKVVKSIDNVEIGDTVNIMFSDGNIDCSVINKKEN
jgi:exodeoxyribonuclease VII large subunit